MDLVAEMPRERKRRRGRSRSERQRERERGGIEEDFHFPLGPLFSYGEFQDPHGTGFGRMLYVYLFVFLSVGVFGRISSMYRDFLSEQCLANLYGT